MSKLKNCPFCGCKPLVTRSNVTGNIIFKCTNTNCEAITTFSSQNQDISIDFYNDRRDMDCYTNESVANYITSKTCEYCDKFVDCKGCEFLDSGLASCKLTYVWQRILNVNEEG